jgi:hypothetical protein
VSKASAAALRSIAKDASRMRLGERGGKDRPADLEILIRGGAGVPSGEEVHEVDHALPDLDEDEDD